MSAAAPVDTAQVGPSPSWIVVGTTGQTQVRLLDCTTGQAGPKTLVPAALSAPPLLAFDGSALFVGTDAQELLRYGLPDLKLHARISLGFVPRRLAVGSGPDAILLAGGQGTTPLSAHTPDTLARLTSYRLPDDATAQVSALLDVPGRKSLVVGFSDRPEIWEIFYDPNAAPALLGLVHDYRGNEAVPLPGRLTARPFRVASATRDLLGGPVPWELARIDTHGAFGVLNLNVRKEIERPSVPSPGSTGRVTWWRTGAADAAARGWVLGAQGGAQGNTELRTIAAPDWSATAPLRAEGEVLALITSQADEQILVAYRSATGPAISVLDPTARTLRRLHPLNPATWPAARTGAEGPARLAQGTDGRCVALLDEHGRWLLRVDASAPPPQGSAEKAQR